MGIIEKEPVFFTGKSVRAYPFTAYDLDTEFFETEFQDIQGVYIFTKQVPTNPKTEKYIRLYVGETNNLATVFQDHEDLPCLKQHGADSICVLLDKDESSRHKKVRDIIDGVGGHPPCNVNDPDE